MINSEKKYDVIVVGAGAAGMMAAISSAENGAKTLLVDKNKRVGKKLLLTGGGRCNVTNINSVDEIIQHVPGNGRFLHSAFAQFDNQDIIQFFKKNGVKLKEEDHGRMFPITDKSSTIVDSLFERLLKLDVDYLPKAAVTDLITENEMIAGLKTDKGDFTGSTVVLATGGITYPSTGSTGDGYKLAKSVGHTVTKLYPTESALISEEKFIKDKTLMGISLRDVELSVLNAKGKTVVAHKMDLLFTHFGLSGPAALRCSSFVNQELAKDQEQVTVNLDLFPDFSEGQLKQTIQKRVKDVPNKALKNLLTELLQERLLLYVLEKSAILPDLPAKQLTEKQIDGLTQFLKNFTIQIDRTLGMEKSFVTGGGVNLKEINPKTLESKVCPGLFFAGELLDINGYTGGYNVTCAFVTGHVSGSHAAEISSYFK